MKVKNKKKIIALSIAILFAVVMLTTVEAAVTNSGSTGLVTSGNWVENLGAELLAALGKILGFAFSGIFSFITPLISGLSAVLLFTLVTLFATSTGEYILPMPDNVVFNKMPFLDANFINPHQRSLINQIGGDLIGDLFLSFQTIAVTAFIVAAMVTGLKIALSTIAAKRAQYKQVAMKWLMGFIILLCLRWILAGIFLINETLVLAFAKIAKSSAFSISVTPTVPVPIIGKIIQDVIGGIKKLLTGTSGIDVPGYLGLIMYSMFAGFTGDIVGSIVGFVILGQTTVILGSYIKRMFMCMFLGVISPLIIATDTIVAVSGGQSQVFKSWFKNFIFTVFSQSFHAAYMVVAFRFMKQATGVADISDTLASIVVITLTTGLVKMEKMLKGMFGFGDSMAGSLADGKKSMKKAMGAVAGLAAASKALADNKPKFEAARKQKAAYTAEQNRIINGRRAANNASNAYTAMKEAKANGNMDEYYRQRKIAADANREAKGYGYEFKNGTINITGGNIQTSGNQGNGGNVSSTGNGKTDYLQSVLNNNAPKQPQTDDERLQVLSDANKAATREMTSAGLAMIMGPANLAAGVGIGIGMDDDIGEALFKGGMITTGLDKATEGIGRSVGRVKGDNEQLLDRRNAQDVGATVKANKTEKSTVEAALTFDVAKLSADLKKEFRGLGEVFGNQVRRELKEIDKDVDNEY